MNRASKAFALIPELFAVSGKAIVTFNIMSKFKKYLNRIFHFHNSIFPFLPNCRAVKKTGFHLPFLGYFGDLSNPPESYMHYSSGQMNKIYLGEAVIRGPIVWLSKTFRELNGFDDVGFVLGRDDCDLSFRGLLRGYRVGYLPTQTFSFYEDGTTRKTKTSKVIEMINGRELLAKSNPGELTKFWTEKKRQQNKTVVIYFRLIRFLITHGRFVYLKSESTSNNFSKFLRLRTPQKSVRTLSQDVTM